MTERAEEKTGAAGKKKSATAILRGMLPAIDAWRDAGMTWKSIAQRLAGEHSMSMSVSSLTGMMVHARRPLKLDARNMAPMDPAGWTPAATGQRRVDYILERMGLIEAARAEGRSLKAIARTMAAAGLEISEKSLAGFLCHARELARSIESGTKQGRTPLRGKGRKKRAPPGQVAPKRQSKTSVVRSLLPEIQELRNGGSALKDIAAWLGREHGLRTTGRGLSELLFFARKPLRRERATAPGPLPDVSGCRMFHLTAKEEQERT